MLFPLAAYVTAAAVWQLWNGTGQEFSWPGFIVALIAIPAMRYLAQRKIVIAEKIGSRALRADAMEAVTCGWLSFVVVASLAAQWLLGAWWIDGVGSLAIVCFLSKRDVKHGLVTDAKPVVVDDYGRSGVVCGECAGT